MSQEIKLNDLPHEIITMASDMGPKFRPTDLRYPGVEYVGITQANNTTFLCNIDHVNYSFGVELKVYIMNNELAINEFEKEIDNFINKVNNWIPAILSLNYCWKFYTFNFAGWGASVVPRQIVSELPKEKKNDEFVNMDHRDSVDCTYWDEDLVSQQSTNTTPPKEILKENNGEFIDMDYRKDSFDDQPVEYTGTHFKIKGITLSKNARDCILDLAKYIKFILRKP
jgi:hypothetical protein